MVEGNPLLLCAIHDVSPRFEGAVDALADRLSAVVGDCRFAMLVVPDHWGSAPLIAGTPFATRLRRWADSGVEMFVHGWFHRDTRRHDSVAARFRARHMTAGEGEFLGLDHDEAAVRMRRGKSLIEDLIGGPVAGFIAPAWLYGAGARGALAQQDFPLAEDHLRVWQPASGKVVARGPVVTWASRSAARRLSSIAFAAAARRALVRQRVVRLAVHPGDVTASAIMASIDSTVSHFRQSHRPGRYAELVR